MPASACVCSCPHRRLRLTQARVAGCDATQAFVNAHPELLSSPSLRALQVAVLSPAEAAPCAADAAYAVLRAELHAEGLFRPAWRFYALYAAWLCFLFCAVWHCTTLNNSAARVASALLLALFWQQAAFAGHDAGHGGVTRNTRADHALGLLLGNAASGVGAGWWQSTHNVHHVAPNSIAHDADIQHLPFLSIHAAGLRGIFSEYHHDDMACPRWALRVLSAQHVLMFPLLCVARFGLLFQGVKVVLWEWRKRHTGLFCAPGSQAVRLAEALSLAVYYTYFATLLCRLPCAAERLAYTALSHAAFGVLHLQINLSHWSREVVPGRRHGEAGFVATQLGSTLNWTCHPLLDWFHGGLQFQIEHHLFPKLPRPHLRRVSPRVKALCAAHGICYHETGFLDATREVVATLRGVALQARALRTELAAATKTE